MKTLQYREKQRTLRVAYAKIGHGGLHKHYGQSLLCTKHVLSEQSGQCQPTVYSVLKLSKYSLCKYVTSNSYSIVVYCL